jgi:DNA topoisomerase-1
MRDRRVARVIKALQELPGQELFTYVEDDGEVRRIDSDDVNAYLREIAGEDFTAKDFRTWAGTVLAAQSLAVIEPVASVRGARKNVTAAVARVAERLGNTPAVCRKCYIHPAILESYIDGELARTLGKRSDRALPDGDLAEDEARVLRFLERRITGASKSTKSAA